MYIAIDFDGTVVEHRYPYIGKDIEYSEYVLKELIKNGHQLILLTMRSSNYLEDAINWFKERDIKLFDINNNRTQITWTSSRKVYANLYIDDCGLGIPYNLDSTGRKMVDWYKVFEVLKKENIIK